MAFAFAILTGFAQVQVTGQEYVASSGIHKLEGIKLECVGLAGQEPSYRCISLVLDAAVKSCMCSLLN